MSYDNRKIMGNGVTTLKENIMIELRSQNKGGKLLNEYLNDPLCNKINWTTWTYKKIYGLREVTTPLIEACRLHSEETALKIIKFIKVSNSTSNYQPIRSVSTGNIQDSYVTLEGANNANNNANSGNSGNSSIITMFEFKADGDSALQLACLNKHYNVISELINSSVKPDLTSIKYMFSNCGYVKEKDKAEIQFRTDVASKFINAIPNINENIINEGNILHYLITKNDHISSEIIDKLMDVGLNINKQDLNKMTPIMLFIKYYGKGSIVLSLLKKIKNKVNYELADKDGNNLLHYLAAYCMVDAADILLENVSARVMLSGKNNKCYTPTDTCIMSKNPNVAKRLISAGCEPNLKLYEIFVAVEQYKAFFANKNTNTPPTEKTNTGAVENQNTFTATDI